MSGRYFERSRSRSDPPHPPRNLPPVTLRPRSRSPAARQRRNPFLVLPEIAPGPAGEQLEPRWRRCRGGWIPRKGLNVNPMRPMPGYCVRLPQLHRIMPLRMPSAILLGLVMSSSIYTFRFLTPYEVCRQLDNMRAVDTQFFGAATGIYRMWYKDDKRHMESVIPNRIAIIWRLHGPDRVPGLGPRIQRQGDQFVVLLNMMMVMAYYGMLAPRARQ